MSPPDDATGGEASRAESLRQSLADRGIVAVVEADGALAVLRLPAASPARTAVVDGSLRAEIALVARRAGFTHVALEIEPPPGAPALGDLAARDANVRRAQSGA